MKKTLFVSALTVALVLAFAATAFAAGGVPNRSSAFLGNATTTEERTLAGGGSKQAYITWGQANSLMTAAEGNVTSTVSGYEAAQGGTPHSGYATTTSKCQVCHSVHKAYLTGTKLTAGTNGGCISCHGATSNFGIVKVSASTGTENRHGGQEQCTNGYCHAVSPHGAGDISTYAAGKSAMLNNKSDNFVAAALLSGSTDAAVVATSGPIPIDTSNGPSGAYVWDAADGDYYAHFNVAINQPALDTTLAAYVTVPQFSVANEAKGRAIVTGYTCTNNGCHINGAFNALSSDAYFGAYVLTSEDKNASTPATFTINSGDLRTQAIKGHTLFDTASNTTAFVASGTCKACHDRKDVRTNRAAFPHSNKVWGSDGSGGYVALYNDAAWFTLNDKADADAENTNTRQITGTSGTYEPRTIAMDGACLKCHVSSDGTAGVGKTF